MKSLLSVADLDSSQLHSILASAKQLKRSSWLNTLKERVLALIFEKPSLRTRVSFEMAMHQLGGTTIYLSPAEIGLGKRETIADIARVLSRYVSIIAARTFSHTTIQQLAKYASIPVINALDDIEHPCQALADMLTIQEKKGDLRNVKLAYIGDGNNVANSLLLAATLCGMEFRIATPPGYEIPEKVISHARSLAKGSGSKIICSDNPQLVAKGADVLYTDVWTSMGQEAEAEERRRVFTGYQINTDLLSLADKDAILMHPLPAHYGEELATGMNDKPQSVVFDEAENRLYVQKAILLMLLS